MVRQRYRSSVVRLLTGRHVSQWIKVLILAGQRTFVAYQVAQSHRAAVVGAFRLQRITLYLGTERMNGAPSGEESKYISHAKTEAERSLFLLSNFRESFNRAARRNESGQIWFKKNINLSVYLNSWKKSVCCSLWFCFCCYGTQPPKVSVFKCLPTLLSDIVGTVCSLWTCPYCVHSEE